MAMSTERKAALILFGSALTEGAWVVLNVWANPSGFVRYLGVSRAVAEPLAWTLAAGTIVAFTSFASRLPSVRANLLKPSWLKVLSLAVALTAGICEEAIFRKVLMDAAAQRGAGLVLQVLLSAVAFGAVHGIWGAFKGSVAAAVGATLATGALGCALAVVYLAGRRLLVPCVVAHFVINALAEPGLVLAALRGEMGRGLGHI